MNSPVDIRPETQIYVVEDIMKHGVLTVKRDTPVYQAIATLVDNQITGLPVVNAAMQLEGIITEKDILKLLYQNHTSAGVVEDFMTKDVVSFDHRDSLADVCRTLTENVFRRVAIMQKKKLVSVISRSDLIREQSKQFHMYDYKDHDRNIIKAKDFMKRGIITVNKDTSVFKAMELLAENKVTGLPVVDDRMHIEGIVTEKDFLKLLFDPNTRPGPVKEYMTTDVVTFTRQDSFYDICDCLIENDFRRVPILDGCRLVGIVSRADVIDTILRCNASLFKRRKTDRI